MTDSEVLTEAKAAAQPEELDPAQAVAQMLDDIATEQKGTIESICRHVTSNCIALALQCHTEGVLASRGLITQLSDLGRERQSCMKPLTAQLGKHLGY